MAEVFVGIDVGGTRIKSVVVSMDRSRLAESTSPTPPGIARDVRGVISTVLSEATGEVTGDVRGVGVVVPGIVDDERGLALNSANLGWTDLDLGPLLSDLAPVVAVGHDVRAGLLGEFHWGAAHGIPNVLFVALGTGLAGALLLDGQLVRPTAWAGEIGHVRVPGANGRCGCGRSGCLETVAAARGLTRSWHALGGVGGVEELLTAVADGHLGAEALWRNAIDGLAGVLAPVVAATGVARVVLGGGVARAGSSLNDPLRSALVERLPDALVPDLRTAELGDLAGALGAARLAMDAAGVGP